MRLSSRPTALLRRLAPRAVVVARRPSTMCASSTAAALTQRNVAVVEGLTPAPLWRFFAEVASLPRPSKQEDR